MPRDSTHARGKRGEALAVTYLESRGYRIVECNFRCRLGELDIVAMDGSTLVFVEVRSKASGQHGGAIATVTRAKQARVARVAQAYLSMRRPRFESCRFDVIGITGGQLEHIEDAFRLGSHL